MKLPLINRSNGNPSTSVTIAWLSFIFVSIAIILGLLEEITFGTTTLKFRMLDASIILALLGPAYGLYGYRRYIDQKNDDGDELKKSNKNP